MIVTGWAPCTTGVGYSLLVDWDDDGVVTGTGDNVTPDVLGGGSWNFSYGRDQARQLSPGAVGRAAFSVCNADRVYSPENADSPLAGDLGPARKVFMDASFQGVDYPLFRGRIGDFQVHVEFTNRNVDFTAFDGLAELQSAEISTQAYRASRTGDLVNVILDAAGWPADLRDVDPGATHPHWWWADGKDAFTALQELILSEGPPSIAYVAPDGVFTFRDRHHRILRERSLDSQASFSAAQFGCDAPVVTGFDYIPPFDYSHGWRDIINQISISSQQLTAETVESVVWEYGVPVSLTAGSTQEITAEASSLFIDAVTPVEGIDYTVSGGPVAVTINRTSGQSTTIRIMATGAAVVTGLQLRATTVENTGVINTNKSDADSISDNGIRTYPQSIIWAGEHDAGAVADIILAHYAIRRPIVGLRIVTQDEAHTEQILTRTISDKIDITNGELGLSSPFLIESVSHTITRIGENRVPVHYAVFGCERDLDRGGDNPFIFDMSGHGFDQGEFGTSGLDDPGSVFIFDDAVQGQFDSGLFGT